MTKKMDQGISRRTFIKGTAVGAGIIASTGRGPIENRTDQAYAATQKIKYSFEIPPPAIPASDIKKIVTTDVVVVGLGTAGIPAALSAVEAGARVVGLEKQARINVSSNHDIGMMGTRLQREQGINLPLKL